MTCRLTSQELLKLLDECGLELQTKPGHLTGTAVQALIEKLNTRPTRSDDSEE